MRVLVHADQCLTETLRPEWEQLEWDGGTLPPDLDLVLIGWPPEDPAMAERLASAAATVGAPTAVWDTSDAGSAICPFGTHADRLLLRSADRRQDYQGADARVLDPGVQPRMHNPMQPTGPRAPVAHLTSGPDPVLDELGSLLGQPERSERSYAVVVVRGSGTTPDRPLELLAEGTVLVASDPGVQAISSAVEVVDTPDTAAQRLRSLTTHAELRRRVAQVGVRRVLSEQSTTVAVDELLADLALATPRRARPVTAIVPTMRPSQIGHVLKFVARQSHGQVQLVLITHGFTADADTAALAQDLGVTDLHLIAADADLTLGSLMNLGVDAADGEYVAKMDDDNFYGTHYLSDLLATFDFSGAEVAGKWAHFTHLEASGATFLRFPQAENRLTRLVQGGTLVLPRSVASALHFEDLPRRVDTTFLEKVASVGGTVYSADRYNFVSVRGAKVDGHTWKITDSELLAKPSAELFFGEPWTHVDI
ncbi:glycosyltransferase family protein [Pseudactinotalea sp.]|uniref:glycosyltransferase family protein n=1 Tax=Pseudactinotalea sp. TaxID=1926260 RepID=UPI003B3B3616